MDKTETPQSRTILSSHHWNAFYLLSALSTLVISLTVAIQPLFLDEVLAISFEQSGTINAHIQVVTQLIGLALVVLYTAQKTIFNRRIPLLLVGFATAALGTFLIPFSKDIELILGLEGLIFYYIMRVMVAMGTDTVQLQITTLAGDVSTRQSTFSLLPNTVFMMVLGGAILTAIFIQIPVSDGRVDRFMWIPFIAAMAGLLLTRYQLPKRIPLLKSGKDYFERVWDMITNDPRMQLCFAASFYVRADMIVVSLFLSLWCISFADMVGVTRDYAVGRAGIMLGVMGLMTLIAMPFWKQYMLHRSRIGAIGISLAITGLGFLSLGMMKNPMSWLVFIPVMIIGIGQAGCLVAPKVLALELAPKDLLGSVQGLFHLVSGLGVVLLVQSGGYYFDAVGPRTPFILIGSGNLFMMVYALWLIISGLDENAEHQLINKNKRKIDLKPLIFMMALLPLIWLVGRVLISGYVPGSSLGEMPVGFINRYLGDWAFNFLIISLGLRPLYEITGIRKLAKYSRMIGLYAFFYAVLHVLTYVWLEWVFHWDKIFEDIHERSFIILGVIAFCILIVLAITSTRDMVRRLGFPKWKRIHNTVYLVNILIMFHFIFAAKHENGEPYVYAAIVLLLLGYRYHQHLNKKAASQPVALELGE
ncbi:MAG: MFS transporter [Magnetococcales bacterium]|nr:MFS transporter [Magnetococcales bacterium]